MGTVVSFVPIVATVVDWDTLLTKADLALGRSVSSSLDAKNVPTFGTAPFIGAVAEFAKEGSDPVLAMRDDRLALRHLHYGFLLEFPRRDFIFLSSYGLNVTPANAGDYAIVSAKFNEWVAFVVTVLTTSESWTHPPLKMLACKLLAWFEVQDFVEAWGLYEKRYTADGLYVLVRK